MISVVPVVDDGILSAVVCSKISVDVSVVPDSPFAFGVPKDVFVSVSINIDSDDDIPSVNEGGVFVALPISSCTTVDPVCNVLSVCVVNFVEPDVIVVSVFGVVVVVVGSTCSVASAVFVVEIFLIANFSAGVDTIVAVVLCKVS